MHAWGRASCIISGPTKEHEQPVASLREPSTAPRTGLAAENAAEEQG